MQTATLLQAPLFQDLCHRRSAHGGPSPKRLAASLRALVIVQPLLWRLGFRHHWLTRPPNLPRPPAQPLERLRSHIVLYNSSPANPGRLFSLGPAKWRRLRSRSPSSSQSPSLSAQRQLLLGPAVFHSGRLTSASAQ